MREQVNYSTCDEQCSGPSLTMAEVRALPVGEKVWVRRHYLHYPYGYKISSTGTLVYISDLFNHPIEDRDKVWKRQP